MTNIATHEIVILLLTLLACTAITVVRMRDLWAVVMLTGIYSFLGASWMLMLDAPDVAFTEAAVGAGIATFLMLGTLALTSRKMEPSSRSPLVPLIVVTVTGGALVYGTFDMPNYGDSQAPNHGWVAPEYIDDAVPKVNPDRFDQLDTNNDHVLSSDEIDAIDENKQFFDQLIHLADKNHDGQLSREETISKVHVDNIVTSVLASYRGYDTLGETVVIFTAGIGVLLLLRKPSRNIENKDAQ